jgi:hypothetical protein
MLAIRQQHKDLLLRINQLYREQPVFPPIPADLLDGSDYKLVLARLYWLEKRGWIKIYRKGRRIRAILPMMLP